MEVVAAGAGGAPFHDHDVREWSRMDSLTGVLERARLETDHWTASTSKYGKVVDSRARTNADGALQQQARRQLEVFQSQVPGGHLQVIKTQTVSSSRWSKKSDSKDFEGLQLALNPLDLSSQKSKASVGRGVGRRPPSRQRLKEENLQEKVSRLCHQIHDSAVERTLTRTKSSSSEDLHLDEKSSKSIEDLEDLEQLQSWRRTSKIRRSLQYPKESKPLSKPSDLPENSGSVRKIREELEKGRRLSTALRNNSVDLQALDQILQTISSSSSNQSDTSEDTKKQKRNSFVTVESLQEVRGRLRHTPVNDEEIDDGIVEDTSDMTRVKSYVYGMENKKPISGTGSLESRTKLLNGNTNLRNEDWYNRRKSYGFEQVHNHTDSPSPISLKSKGRVESSTDSGICRSSEIVLVPTAKPESFTSVKQISSIFDQGFGGKSTTITIPIVSNLDNEETKRHSIAVDESKYVTNPNENKFRRTSLAVDDPSFQNRRSKKVEFCKTEVHFAAESGKVNIVETDEKPPPTNNFRRRRRNSLLSDDFERADLPMLHFGDSSYEKVLLGGTDEDKPSHVSYSTVTVNSVPVEYQNDERKDFENVKGILKNKPVKPTPYHLGEEHFLNSSDSDSGRWGVRLRPVQETPFWKSTVTLHNTVYGNESDKEEAPEFQKLLKNLRPTGGNKPDLLNASVKFVTGGENNNRKVWSVADRVKLSEEGHWAENKLYSTKVNFGDGGAAVVEQKEPLKESEKILNKGLVVRIGRDSNSKHTVCSKTTSDSTTTTKITIDLSPSPTNTNLLNSPIVPCTKRSHCFKSTSLVLDTLKTSQTNIPQQLEALKKLYEDVQSDSDADKEVQKLMGRMELKDDNTSEISGSWSKMKACRIFNEHNQTRDIPCAKIEKDSKICTSKFGIEENPRYKFHSINKNDLASPSLVGRNSNTHLYSEKYEKRNTDFVNVSDSRLYEKHDIVLRQPKKSEMTYFGVRVSPQPKETVINPENKLSEKPDLLQHMKSGNSNSTNRMKSPDRQPIYMNVRNKKTAEFDSTILEELTKAADQIMLAVNGFTDDDSHKPSEEEKLELLATITESKQWTQEEKKTSKEINTKIKLKHTSSTSSVESLARARSKAAPIKKRIGVSEASNTRATTRARRLQRASSREALLQSHGSSSEDLGVTVETPVRKPRQIKKTRATQISVTNGIEMKKSTPPNPPRRRSRSKTEEKIQPIPEIRHKTAVSTIRSTAERSSRDRTRDEARKKVVQRKEVSRGGKVEVKRSLPTKEISNHRISTANIKKCPRAEERSRQRN